jgi:bifunctional non-homologous end joining protein LigD
MARAGTRRKQRVADPMPTDVKPMLASLVDIPFDRAGWLFEIKWDGYRAIAEVSGGKVALYSRTHKSFVDRYPAVAQALRGLGHDAVLDGELAVVDDRGRSSFQLLQGFLKTGQGQLCYCVFDLLYLDGQDLRALPLSRRKEKLATIVSHSPLLLLSQHIEGEGVAFFHEAIKRGLEGIMAKDAASPYREGHRGQEWLKIKTHMRQEAVICGFTEPRGSRKDFGALVLGVYEGKKLVYVGHTGGGFNVRGLTEVRRRLDPLVQPKSPFGVTPKTNAPVHWVKPKLVCEVRFQEWTQDDIMRMPIFLGIREDKPARAVTREPVKPVRQAVKGLKDEG